MKVYLLLLGLLFYGNYHLSGQDLHGIDDSLLFTSDLEKKAFQTCDNNEFDPLIFLLACDPDIDSVKYYKIKHELLAYAGKLRAKQNKYSNEIKFLHFVFFNVHNQYLRRYRQTETFYEIFNEGIYNCVSGTALYAWLMSQLGYSPEIFELRYHMFLSVALNNSRQILLETTDPLNGFVDSNELILRRIRQYLDGEKEALKKNRLLSAPFNNEIIFQEISLKKLTGLQYYNLAIDLINEKNYFDALRALKKAGILYPESQRIKDFLLFTITQYEPKPSNVLATN
jgi:hypothetical protein